jgi:hypothetical protein
VKSRSSRAGRSSFSEVSDCRSSSRRPCNT